MSFHRTFKHQLLSNIIQSCSFYLFHWPGFGAKTKNYYGPMIIQTDKNNYLFSVKKESLKKIDFLYFITESVDIC